VKGGRRPLFFLIVVATCLALVAPPPAEFRWVNYAMAGLAAFWGLMTGLEALSRGRGERSAGV
jgi:hypothetical protein